MPVYNEAGVLAAVLAEVTEQVLDRVDEAELVLVDDRGGDGSDRIMHDLAARDGRLRVITNASNVGHGPSVRHGLDACRGEWILLLDSDDQLDVGDFAPMWEKRDDADLIFGVRTGRDDPRHRLALSTAANGLVSILIGTRIRDANAGFKLVRHSLYEHLRPTIPANSFAPSILLVMGAIRSGARVVPVEVTHRARPSGTSTLRAGRLARAVALSAVQTTAYRARRVTPFSPPSKP